MLVKVRFQDVICRRPKATLFLLNGHRQEWVPNALIRYGAQGKCLLLPLAFAQAKKLEYKSCVHIPDKIPPQYGQKVIDELVFRAEESR